MASQIFFQAVYFGTLGLDGGDAVAINSLIFTSISVLYGTWYLLNVKLCPDGEFYSAEGFAAAVAAKRSEFAAAVAAKRRGTGGRDQTVVKNEAYEFSQPKASPPIKVPPRSAYYANNTDDNPKAYGF